jgi:hypothetical protein
MKKSKIALVLIIFIAILIFGFITLIRSCLSQYDERAKIDNAFIYQYLDKDVVVFLFEYQSCTSFSSQGGYTRKSVTNYYYLQTRDAEDLHLIKQTEFDNDKVPNTSALKLFGVVDNVIWLFAGEILGFDPLSHEVKVNKDTLIQKNMFLKDILPVELTYYKFEPLNDRLIITAKNGIYYGIDCKTLLAVEISDLKPIDPVAEQIKIKIKELENRRLALMKGRFSGPEYWSLRDTMYRWEDSLRYREGIREMREEMIKKRYDNVSSYRSLLKNGVITGSKVYGILGEKDINDDSKRFYFRGINYDIERRKMYYADVKKIYDGHSLSAEIGQWQMLNPSGTFLNGGLLINKFNDEVIELESPKSLIIVHSKQVGDKSPLIISRIDLNGNLLWSKEIPMVQIYDMVLGKNHLILFSNDGIKVTGSRAHNWIMSINLQSGNFILKDLMEKE